MLCPGFSEGKSRLTTKGRTDGHGHFANKFRMKYRENTMQKENVECISKVYPNQKLYIYISVHLVSILIPPLPYFP